MLANNIFFHFFIFFVFLRFTSVFPSIGGWTVLALQDFCWSGETFYVRMPFLSTTNNVYVGARTFNLSVESPTRNLYTTAGPMCDDEMKSGLSYECILLLTCTSCHASFKQLRDKE